MLSVRRRWSHTAKLVEHQAILAQLRQLVSARPPGTALTLLAYSLPAQAQTSTGVKYLYYYPSGGITNTISLNDSSSASITRLRSIPPRFGGMDECAK